MRRSHDQSKSVATVTIPLLYALCNDSFHSLYIAITLMDFVIKAFFRKALITFVIKRALALFKRLHINNSSQDPIFKQPFELVLVIITFTPPFLPPLSLSPSLLLSAFVMTSSFLLCSLWIHLQRSGAAVFAALGCFWWVSSPPPPISTLPTVWLLEEKAHHPRVCVSFGAFSLEVPKYTPCNTSLMWKGFGTMLIRVHLNQTKHSRCIISSHQRIPYISVSLNSELCGIMFIRYSWKTPFREIHDTIIEELNLPFCKSSLICSFSSTVFDMN